MKLPKILDYYILSVSSYHPDYPPGNILKDEPENLASRWVSHSTVSPQYIVLALQRPALVRRIRIGKTNLSSNSVKRLRVFGGVTEDNMTMLLDVSLQDDQLAEIFTLRSQDGRAVPCKVIKIEPVEPLSASETYCIYSVALLGYEENESVFNSEIQRYKYHKRYESLRLCMKQLRRENLHAALASLTSSVPEIRLEHPLLSQLYSSLVLEGNFSKCDSILQELGDEGLLARGRGDNRYQISWKMLHDVSDCESSSQPGQRGGHQMTFDPQERRIYLFGGWDGQRDLGDFWYFDVNTSIWHRISEDTSQEGGPSARSCHKMCIDAKRRRLYVLGKYPAPKTRRTVQSFCNEFYRYCLISGTWDVVSESTATDNGPPVIYDHQMVMHVEANAIFVFGGKVLGHDSSRLSSRPQTFYSGWAGLYRYSIADKEWTLLQEDSNQLPSRMSHCMVLNPIANEFYIFGGNRGQQLIKEMYVYDVSTGRPQRHNDRNSMLKNLRATRSYTQRATIDPEKNEIYVYSSICKEQQSKPGQHTSFWIYDIEAMSWTCVHQNSSLAMKNESEPIPRYAHQLVYDPKEKVHYLFGGNPAVSGANSTSSERLNDLWSFRLHHPLCNVPLRRCRYWLRRQQFRELLESPNPSGFCAAIPNEEKAFHLLRNELFDVVDHFNKREQQELHQLASWVIRGTAGVLEDFDWDTSGAWRRETALEGQRLLVWNQICSYIPAHLREPVKNVSDLCGPAPH